MPYFKTLTFQQKNECLQVTLLDLFTIDIPLAEVEPLGEFTLRNSHFIQFKNEKAETKFSYLLTKYFQHLTNKLTGNKTTYIHQNSGIPLIGNVAFGIAYRNTSIIEIKPMTSCNLNCVYCSVSEGLQSKKNDFIVEKDYLVAELKKVIAFVNEPVEIHVGVQGEPFLYAGLEELISDLQRMKLVHRISIDTNATLLTKKTIDRLSKKSKLQLNVSLDSLDPILAKKMAGILSYNLEHVKEMIAYAAEKMNVIVVPVLVPGWNEEEIERIILWIKSLKKQPLIGIQNFLKYKTGRHPTKEWNWNQFYARLEKLEQKYDLKLKLSAEDFQIKKTKPLLKPFQDEEVVSAVIKCPDRFPHTCIAVSKNRNISVINCDTKIGKEVKIKIIRDKHNIFSGKLMK